MLTPIVPTTIEEMDEAPDPEVYRLRMRAEVGAESPLWTMNGTLVDFDQLPISAELENELGLWADQIWSYPTPAGWREEGKVLHARLVEELGPEYEVILDYE